MKKVGFAEGGPLRTVEPLELRRRGGVLFSWPEMCSGAFRAPSLLFSPYTATARQPVHMDAAVSTDTRASTFPRVGSCQWATSSLS